MMPAAGNVVFLRHQREGISMAMFEVGKRYKIGTWEDGGPGYSVSTVVEIDDKLIKIVGPDPARPTVLNTASPYFVSADLDR